MTKSPEKTTSDKEIPNRVRFEISMYINCGFLILLLKKLYPIHINTFWAKCKQEKGCTKDENQPNIKKTTRFS